MVDEIAWPKKAKPEMSQGVAFFNLMRNLVATGTLSLEIGVKDVGYIPAMYPISGMVYQKMYCGNITWPIQKKNSRSVSVFPDLKS